MRLQCFNGRDQCFCVSVDDEGKLNDFANVCERQDSLILDWHDSRGRLRVADSLAVSVVFDQRRFRVEGRQVAAAEVFPMFVVILIIAKAVNVFDPTVRASFHHVHVNVQGARCIATAWFRSRDLRPYVQGKANVDVEPGGGSTSKTWFDVASCL